MLPDYPLDGLPIPVDFVLFVVLAALVYEVAFRIGRWHQERTPDEKEGPAVMITGSLLALFAFLRAGYLPSPYDAEIRDLLRQYAPLRISVPDAAQYLANYRAAQGLQGQIWSKTEELARAHPDSEVLGQFIVTVNETIDVSNERLVAGVYARVPETIIWVLVGVSLMSLAMVGYSAGLTRKRAEVGSVALILVMSIVLTVIVDLDRPRSGFLTVSQTPLVDLVKQLGPPGS